MREYLLEYIKELEERLNNKEKLSKEEKFEIEIKIAWFQHERLIHLLVTLFYALFTLTFMALGLVSYYFLIPFFPLIIFLAFYIRHYFFLEHGVQYLYKLYDKLKNI